MGQVSKEWKDGWQAGYDFCKMLSESKTYHGPFWPDAEKYGVGSYRNGFAEGVITGRSHFKIDYRWVDDGQGSTSHIEKV
jgi:hypothetical protein